MRSRKSGFQIGGFRDVLVGCRVFVVFEDLATLNTPDHDVVQDTGRVKAGLSRHGLILSHSKIL